MPRDVRVRRNPAPRALSNFGDGVGIFVGQCRDKAPRGSLARRYQMVVPPVPQRILRKAAARRASSKGRLHCLRKDMTTRTWAPERSPRDGPPVDGHVRDEARVRRETCRAARRWTPCRSQRPAHDRNQRRERILETHSSAPHRRHAHVAFLRRAARTIVARWSVASTRPRWIVVGRELPHARRACLVFARDGHAGQLPQCGCCCRRSGLRLFRASFAASRGARRIFAIRRDAFVARQSCAELLYHHAVVQNVSCAMNAGCPQPLLSLY